MHDWWCMCHKCLCRTPTQCSYTIAHQYDQEGIKLFFSHFWIHFVYSLSFCTAQWTRYGLKIWTHFHGWTTDPTPTSLALSRMYRLSVSRKTTDKLYKRRNYPCCTVNHPQAYPKFWSHSFMTDEKSGSLIHALLGPATFSGTVGKSNNVKGILSAIEYEDLDR